MRGIAFVEFDDAESAKKALECAGRIVNGRSVAVTPANLTREERAAKEELLADGEMNFVAATNKTFDHPTHGSLRTGQDPDDAHKSLLHNADPMTGEPLDRNPKGHWLHDERDDNTRNTLTNADIRRMHGQQRGAAGAGGGGMRSETEGAREARIAAAVAAAAAAGSSHKSSSGYSADRGSGGGGYAPTSEVDRKERHKKKSRSRSRSRSPERRRHRSGRKRSRSR